jgi:hypothetical protein
MQQISTAKCTPCCIFHSDSIYLNAEPLIPTLERLNEQYWPYVACMCSKLVPWVWGRAGQSARQSANPCWVGSSLHTQLLEMSLCLLQIQRAGGVNLIAAPGALWPGGSGRGKGGGGGYAHT